MRLGFIGHTLIVATLAIGCGTTPDGDDDSADSTSDADSALTDSAALPHFQVVFQVPKADGTGDSTIDDEIIKLFGQADVHSTIRVGMYQWTHTAPATALVNAYKRGVHVQVVLDEQANFVTPPVARLANDADADDSDLDPEGDDTTTVTPTANHLNPAIEILKHGLPSTSITFCTRGSGSCQGNGIDHNKIYMFSKLSDGSTDVVVQASANLSTYHLHNNLVISRGDKKLYDDYITYFDALKRQHENLDYDKDFDGNHTIAYMFPRETDTIVNILGNVRCTSSSTIRITMAFWTDDRMDIVRSLHDLVGKGCDVRVNMRKAGTNSSANVIADLKRDGIKVGNYPSNNGVNIHSKYLLIDSEYETVNGKSHRKLVWTGSHNYTNGALHDNDEVLLRVDNADVFAAFTANWNEIHEQIVNF
jgi:HKD family nuclease